MGNEKYFGYEKVISDALVAARGVKVSTTEDKILILERKLETLKLSHVEISEIQKQLKLLRGI